MSSYMIESWFISLQTYNDMILAGHTLVISIKLFAEHFPDEHFHPKLFGSDRCERLFAYLRGFYRGKSNLCMLDILDICGRILKFEELTYEDVSQKETLVPWSMTTEQDIPVEELIETESDILCSVAEEIDQSSAYALSDVAASTQTSKTLQAELLNDEDDEDNPSQCHLFQLGTCKYMDENFRSPANTHWLGCDYPGCYNWFYESCLGVKFITF